MDDAASYTDDSFKEKSFRGVGRSHSYDEYHSPIQSGTPGVAAAASLSSPSQHNETLYDELLRYHTDIMDDAFSSVGCSTQSSDKKPAARPTKKYNNNPNHVNSIRSNSFRRHNNTKSVDDSVMAPSSPPLQSRVPRRASCSSAASGGSNRDPIPRNYFSTSMTGNRSQSTGSSRSGPSSPRRARPPSLMSQPSLSSSDDPLAPSDPFSPSDFGGFGGGSDPLGVGNTDPLGGGEGLGGGSGGGGLGEGSDNEPKGLTLSLKEEIEQFGKRDSAFSDSHGEEGKERHGALHRAMSSNVEEDQELARQIFMEEEEMKRKRQEQAVSYHPKEENVSYHPKEEEVLPSHPPPQQSPNILSEDEELARRLQEEEAEAAGVPPLVENQPNHEILHSQSPQGSSPSHMERTGEDALLMDDEALARQLQEEEEKAQRVAQMQRRMEAQTPFPPPLNTPPFPPHPQMPPSMDNSVMYRREMEQQGGGSGNNELEEQRRILERIQQQEEEKQLQWAMRESGAGGYPGDGGGYPPRGGGVVDYTRHHHREDPYSGGGGGYYNPPVGGGPDPLRGGSNHVLRLGGGGGGGGFDHRPYDPPRGGPPPYWQDSQEHAWSAYPEQPRRPSTTDMTTSSFHSAESLHATPQSPQSHPSPSTSSSGDRHRHEVVHRGQEETAQAIRSGQSHVVMCQGCNVRLQAPVQYSLVYCPHCGSVSPGQASSA